MSRQVDNYNNIFTNGNFSNWMRENGRWGFLLEESDAHKQLQLFNSGFNIETFSYYELCNLSWILTKELFAQISRDHYIFWTWCGFVGNYFKINYDKFSHMDSLFKDWDWFHSFNALLNLLLLRSNNIPPFYENYFLSRLSLYRAVIAGPLCYSLLEGLLRRRNSRYLNKDGKTIANFTILVDNKPITYALNRSVNRIHHLLALFEQVSITIDRKHRDCIGLKELKRESIILHNYDTFDQFIDMGRNTVLHGENYWQTRYPIVLNLLCLLLVDSINPEDYNNNRSEFLEFLNSYQYKSSSVYQLSGKDELLKNEIFYPPNITF